jgi:hypothetical protein
VLYQAELRSDPKDLVILLTNSTHRLIWYGNLMTIAFQHSDGIEKNFNTFREKFTLSANLQPAGDVFG